MTPRCSIARMRPTRLGHYTDATWPPVRRALSGGPGSMRVKIWSSRSSAEPQRAETELAGWAYRIRTGESVRELSNWNSLTTWLRSAQARRRRPFACELRATDCNSGPDFSRRSSERQTPRLPNPKMTLALDIPASHEPSHVVLDLTGLRCTRCSFVASHVRSGLGYRSSGGAPARVILFIGC